MCMKVKKKKKKVAKVIVFNFNFQQLVKPFKSCKGYYPGARIYDNNDDNKAMMTMNQVKAKDMGLSI